MNKKNQTAVWTAAAVLAVSMILTGCGRTGFTSFSPAASPESTATQNYAADDSGNGVAINEKAVSFSAASAADNSMVTADGTDTQSGTTGTDSTTSDRKLVRTVNISAETEDIDDFETKLTKQVQDAGGYLEYTSRNGGTPIYYADGSDSSTADASYDSSQTQTGSYTARIPDDKLDAFTAQISGETNVLSRSAQVDDITLQYNDTDSRRTALETEQKQLLSMMKNTDNVQDLIAIEQQLTDVNAQLQDLESQMKLYDNQVDYATVSIDVTEVKDYSPVPQQDPLSRMRDGLYKSWNKLLSNLKEFGIWFVINLPFIVFWLIVLLIVLLIIKGIRRHHADHGFREPAGRVRRIRVKQQKRKKDAGGTVPDDPADHTKPTPQG